MCNCDKNKLHYQMHPMDRAIKINIEGCDMGLRFIKDNNDHDKEDLSWIDDLNPLIDYRIGIMSTLPEEAKESVREAIWNSLTYVIDFNKIKNTNLVFEPCNSISNMFDKECTNKPDLLKDERETYDRLSRKKRSTAGQHMFRSTSSGIVYDTSVQPPYPHGDINDCGEEGLYRWLKIILGK